MSSRPPRRWRARSARELPGRLRSHHRRRPDRHTSRDPAAAPRYAGDCFTRAGPDPRKGTPEAGRSINLALADRGIHALKLAGVFDQIEGALVPMRGRWVHQRDGSSALQPYGRRANEIIFSDIAASAQPGAAGGGRAPGRREVAIRASARSMPTSKRQVAHVRDLRSGRLLDIPMQPLIATDGAGSVLRRRMAAAGLIAAHESRPRARLQGADDSAGSGGRTSDGTRGAAYLAARRLHADRAAEHGRQLHGHLVPARGGDVEFRKPDLARGDRGVSDRRAFPTYAT